MRDFKINRKFISNIDDKLRISDSQIHVHNMHKEFLAIQRVISLNETFF